jgi:hypothetical protein
MAYKQQDWKDALQAAKPERSGSNNNFDQGEAKKQARLMYNKRSLQKEIKKLLTNKIIKFNDVIRIQNRYGIYVT